MNLLPRNMFDMWLASMSGEDQWQKGRLCRRAGLGSSELIEREECDIPEVEDQITAVLDLLESPIEQLAAYHLLGRNYAPFTTEQVVFARIFRNLPEEWPEDLIIAIVPQVEVGQYRVDFMVHLRNGTKFAIECDGEEFHDARRDGVRDARLSAYFKLTVLRFSGSTIWEGPLWTNEIRKMVFVLLGIRDAERMQTHG